MDHGINLIFLFQDSEFPVDSGINPYLAYAKNSPGHLTRTGGFRLTSTFQAHSLAVSAIALHPRKQIIATSSDDFTWKMWAVPSGDLVMTGEGHTDWVSSCDFHPSGGKLATGLLPITLNTISHQHESILL